ncbi:MAG: hypothetical protein V1816_27295 [Pseudomonadota bacterium]
MIIRRKMYFLRLLVISILLNCGCSPSDSSSQISYYPWQKNKPRASTKLNADRLISELTKQGYEVERGYFKLYTKDECPYSYEVMETCYGNNPAAPYVLPVVPYWPREFVDASTKFAFGPTDDGYGSTFRIDRSEAIIIFGLLPPQAAYLGIQTYLFTREGSYDKNSVQYRYFEVVKPEMLNTFFATIPNNPKRIQLLASLSNSINNVVIERQAGSAFDQERYIIITPDQYMDSVVRDALNQISVENANIFTEPIPPTVRTGLDEQADDFLTAIRYAMPYDGGNTGTPSDSWRNDLPLVVLRVRDANQQRVPLPYDMVSLEARTAEDEGGLNADFINLIVEVGNKWGQSCANADCSDITSNFIDMQEPPMNLVGPQCTEIGMNCLGDTQDTTYQLSSNLKLDSGEIYAVIGSLGTTTENATYVGLSVNYTLMKKGVENISSDQLKGSALEYSGKVNNADKFYVYYITRDCSGLEALTEGNCLSIPETMIPPCSPEASEPCGYAKLVQREYIRPGTQRGPNSKLVILPRVLKLQRPLI